MLPELRNHEELSLSELDGYPMLRDVFKVWTEDCTASGLPRAIDILDVPPRLLPYVMLLDWDGQREVTIRLAGTYVCDRHGGELRGKSPRQFFSAVDAEQVIDSMITIGRTGQPSLARRSYIHLHGNYWSYVRLILPLSRGGERIDGFFKVLDPDSLSESAPTDELEAALKRSA